MAKIIKIIDDISEGEKEFEKAKKQVAEVIAFYESLRKAVVPESIENVTDEKEPATEKHSPKLPKKVFKQWNVRASKIEKVNEALANFELGVVEELTVSTSSIIFHEIHWLIRKLEWILSHIGELTLLLAGTLGYTKGRWGKELWDALKETVIAGESAFTSDAGNEAFQKKFGILADKVEEAGAFLIKSAALGVVAKVMLTSISRFTEKFYYGMVAPIKTLKGLTEQKLQADAFPQRSGRYRRYKAHRALH